MTLNRLISRRQVLRTGAAFTAMSALSPARVAMAGPTEDPFVLRAAAGQAAEGLRHYIIVDSLYAKKPEDKKKMLEKLGDDPIIASLSLGAERIFSLKGKIGTYNLTLEDGSLLYMGKGTQKNYYHQVPKSYKKVSPRINLTFRYIKT